MTKTLTGAFAALFIMGGLGSAQDTIGADDLLFLQRAAKNGFLEMRIGKLALEHSETQAVRDLAQKMIEDHTRTTKELAELAQKKGVAMPGDDGSGVVNLAMAKATGKEFDELFRKEVIVDHENDIKIFETELKTGTDKELQSWASRALASMKQHLADAKALPEMP